MRPDEFKQKLMMLDDKIMKLSAETQQKLYDIADKYELIYNELILTDSYSPDKESELLDNYYSELVLAIETDANVGK